MGKLGNVIECIEKAMLFAEGENERMVTIGYGVMEDAFALLKAQENEIKALRLLVDWAEECDFGLDNIRWREYVTKEELDTVEDYIEKMIYVARRAVEQG